MGHGLVLVFILVLSWDLSYYDPGPWLFFLSCFGFGFGFCLVMYFDTVDVVPEALVDIIILIRGRGIRIIHS